MGMPVITPGTITLEEAVGDIIESIAMEEKSIAHILNAESEKLQAIINMPDATVQQLMATNRSVKNAIDTVIRLELALKSKLDLFSNMICKIS